MKKETKFMNLSKTKLKMKLNKVEIEKTYKWERLKYCFNFETYMEIEDKIYNFISKIS